MIDTLLGTSLKTLLKTTGNQFQEAYKDIVEKSIEPIVRPPRTHYDLASLPTVLCADEEEGYMYSFNRIALEILNERCQKIQGSLYFQENYSSPRGMPCVIYMHGNASSQLEGQFLVPNLCPHGIAVFCFDFIGCGESEGDKVSLGHFETEDAFFIMEFLHFTFDMSKYALWGRSMGAATALNVNHPMVVCKVSDSAFTCIEELIKDIAISYHVPSIIAPSVISYMRDKVKAVSRFDISTVRPIDVVSKTPIFTIFGHALDDQFIPYEQSERLYAACKHPDKKLVCLSGGHNARRNDNWIRTGVEAILKAFDIKVDYLYISECRKLQSTGAHFESFISLLGNGRANDEENIDASSILKQKTEEFMKEEAEDEAKLNEQEMEEDEGEKSKNKRKAKRSRKSRKKSASNEIIEAEIKSQLQGEEKSEVEGKKKSKKRKKKGSKSDSKAAEVEQIGAKEEGEVPSEEKIKKKKSKRSKKKENGTKREHHHHHHKLDTEKKDDASAPDADKKSSRKHHHKSKKKSSKDTET